jgi:hypothetical protein
LDPGDDFFKQPCILVGAVVKIRDQADPHAIESGWQFFTRNILTGDRQTIGFDPKSICD